MPDDSSPALAVLEALGFALFVRDDAGGLHSLGKAPGWLVQLWPKLEDDGTLPVAHASPFLENFLIDAEESWRKGGGERADSGPWIEQDGNGDAVELQATALTAAGRSILLIERLGEAFAAKKAVLQRARETVIAHQRLNSEIQKKEILLHCVADEMSAALANVITSLRLIEMEENGPRTKLLLALASRATHEQQTLIHRILGVFEDELRGVYGAASADPCSTGWDDALRHALESAAPLFQEKQVRLEMDGEAADVRLALDRHHLERVISNLLENALERSPSTGAVIVRVKEEADVLFAGFDDQGPALADEACENLFARFNPAGLSASASALRLHFCRIVVENSGGEIGCSPLPEGGCRFWIRLTKSSAGK
jgi:signal transduction histidine kinase